MAASSVGGGLAPQLRCDLGFRDGRYPPPPPRSCLRPPRRVSRLICGGGARPGAAASRNQQRQLGELEAEAEAGLEHQRSSPREVREEMARCFDLVRRLGRGAVYLRSSRVPPTHPHYLHSTELAREIARLLDCTTWTGAGSGLMDDAIQGALELDKPVGGFKISKEAATAVRSSPTDRTAVVVLPGGVGTLDELFEIMALIQLERIGSAHPVPFLLLNYDSYYSKLLDFLNDCQEWGTVAPGEVESLWKVCNGNYEALEYLAELYDVPAAERNYHLSPQFKQQRISYATS